VADITPKDASATSMDMDLWLKTLPHPWHGERSGEMEERTMFTGGGSLIT